MTTTDPAPELVVPPPPSGPVTRRPDDDRMTTAQWVRVVILGALLVVLTATTGVWGLAVVFGILLFIFLHELGHYVAAKRAGMKVTEFFIGFGPRIWSFTRGETEYGLKVIPAGAYVRIIGMNNMEEVAPEDEARSYRQARYRDRLLTVLAGPLMNFASALVLIWVILALIGSPGGTITGKGDPTNWRIDRIYPGTGAAEAGIKAGDKIVSVNGKAVVRYDDLRALIQPNIGKTVKVTYTRAGVAQTVAVKLHPYTDENGTTACCLGVRQLQLGMERKRVNPLVAVPRSFGELGHITQIALAGFGHIFSPTGVKNYAHNVSHAKADKVAVQQAAKNGIAPAYATTKSGASASNDERPISILGIFSLGTDAARSGWLPLLSIFMLLNISLGIINLVPLMPFDGGHAALATYEKFQEKRRHLSGRYFTDASRLLPLTYAVLLLLVAISLTSIYLDITNPLKIS